MSDTPTSRVIAQPPLRLYVETTPDSYEWVVDPRCQVEEVKRGLGTEFSTAVVSVYAGPIDSPAAGAAAGIEGNWTEDALAPGQVLWAPETGRGDRPGTPFRKFITPEQFVFVGRQWPAEGETPGVLEVLLVGSCDVPRYDRSSAGGQVRERYTLLVEDTWKRINRRATAQVLGRWMRTGPAAAELAARIEADPEAADQPFQSAASASAIDDLLHVEAYPCVFNPGGRANCSPAPIEVAIDLDDGNGPQNLSIYVFTTERDPNAIPWTYARALRYLAFFHLWGKEVTTFAGVPFYMQDGGEPASWPGPAGIIAATEKSFDAPSGGTKKVIEAGVDDRLAAPASREDALAYELVGRPTELDCDAATLGEAFNLLAEAAGLRYAWRAEPELDEEGAPTGRPLVRIVWWARGAGRLANFSLAGLGGLPARTDPTYTQQLLDANNVAALSLQQDYSDWVGNPDVFGDVERFEITQEFVPGWLPDANLDDVADVEAALDYAKEHIGLSVEDGLEDDPWFQRYHKLGSLFGEHKTKGRRWVLNEDGRYVAQKLGPDGQPLDPAELVYARVNSPWQIDQYAAWTPKQSNIRRAVLDDGGVVQQVAVRDPDDPEPGDAWEAEAGRPWSARPRPLHDCLSADADRQSLGVVVEVAALSEDAGEREAQLAADHNELAWVRLTGVPILTLAQHASIYIDADDLTAVQPWAADDTVTDSQLDLLSLWAAMVEGRLLLRVTAVIEGDRRCRPSLGTDEALATRQFDLSKRFHQNRRDLANSVLAEYPEGELEVPDGNKPVGNRPAPAQTADADADADLLELQKAAQGLLATCQARLQPGQIDVPWVTEQYAIGDTVQKIEGADIEFFSLGSAGEMKFPDIVAVVTRPGRTSYFLEDTRLLDELRRDPAWPFVAAEVEKGEKRNLEAV